MRMELSNRKSHNFIRENCKSILAAILLVVFLIGFFYETAEIGHECEGDNCPICSCIQHLNELHIGRSGNSVICKVILSIFVLTMESLWITEPIFETLVERKVRLNN